MVATSTEHSAQFLSTTSPRRPPPPLNLKSCSLIHSFIRSITQLKRKSAVTTYTVEQDSKAKALTAAQKLQNHNTKTIQQTLQTVVYGFLNISYSFIHFISQNTSYIKTMKNKRTKSVPYRTERPVALTTAHTNTKHKAKQTQSK